MTSFSLLTKTALPLAVYFLSTELDKFEGASIWLVISLRVLYVVALVSRVVILLVTRQEILKLDDSSCSLVRIEKNSHPVKKKKKKAATNGDSVKVSAPSPVVEFEEIRVLEYDCRQFWVLARTFIMEFIISIAVQRFISKSVQSERMLYLYGVFVGPINTLENELVKMYFLKTSNPLLTARPFQTDAEKMNKLSMWSFSEQLNKQDINPFADVKNRFEDRMNNRKR
jgi:hypothetical protein